MRALLSRVARALRLADGTKLLVGAVGDGQYLKRSGTGIVGDTPTSGAPGDAEYWVSAASGSLSAERVVSTYGDIAAETGTGTVLLRPRGRRRSLTWTNNGGSSSAWKGEGHADRTLGGSTNVAAVVGCGGASNTAASAGAQAGWVSPTPDLATAAGHDAEWYYGVGSNVADQRHFVGMTSTGVTASSSTPAGDNYLARYDTTVPDSEWVLSTRDNTTTGTTATGWGAPQASDIWHFQSRYRAGTSVAMRARVYRSGAWSSWSAWVERTATLPRTTTTFGPVAGVGTTVASAKSCTVFTYVSWESLG